MLVGNSTETMANAVYTKQASQADAKKDSLQEEKSQKPQAAAELTLSGSLRQIAEENILSAQSGIVDVLKADEMIQQANQSILNQADDAIKVQSGQTAAAVAELLK